MTGVEFLITIPVH